MALTFRLRLTIWYVAVMGCLLTLTAAGLIYSLHRIAQKRFDTQLWMLSRKEAEAITPQLRERKPNQTDVFLLLDGPLGKPAESANRYPQEYVTVLDDRGRTAGLSAILANPLPTNETLFARSLQGEVVYQTAEVEGAGPLRIVYTPIRLPAVPRPFVVMLGMPESFVGSEIRGLEVVFALGLISILLLTAASAMLLAERAIKPIEEIMSAAESITASELRRRLPASRINDPIGRLADVLNQMLGRLDASFEAQRNFTARAAHELRTPLTILKGEAQVALRRKRSVEEYEALLSSNLEEIEKLVVMIDELLLLARYEGGEMAAPRDPVRLDEIVAGVATGLTAVADDFGIDLQAVTDESLTVEGDSKALERLAANLVGNALRYTLQGGRVTARVKGEDHHANLIVEDTGVGIAAEDMPYIFQQFYRSPAARRMRPEGTGLGLALSAVIAHLHGASINVTSDKGAGTRVVVSFPLYQSDLPAQPATDSVRKPKD